MLTNAQAEAPPAVIDLMAVGQVDEMSAKLPPHVIASMKALFDKLYDKITPQAEADDQMQEAESAPVSAPISARASTRGAFTPVTGAFTPIMASTRGSNRDSNRGSATPTSALSRPTSSRRSPTPALSVGSIQAETPVEPETITEPVVRDPTPKPVEEAAVDEPIVEEAMLDAAPLEAAIIESTPNDIIQKEASPVPAASIEPAAEEKPVELQAEASPVREITPFETVPVQVVTENNPEPDKMDEDPVENHVEPQIHQDEDMEMLL